MNWFKRILGYLQAAPPPDPRQEYLIGYRWAAGELLSGSTPETIFNTIGKDYFFHGKTDMLAGIHAALVAWATLAELKLAPTTTKE